MRQINYKCKNCGGNVSYNSNESVLTCTYCKTSYENFVKIEDVGIDNLIEKLEIYSYSCSKCGNILNSYSKLSNEECICSKCNSKEVLESKQLINGVISNELVERYVCNDYLKELVGIEEYVPKEFLSLKFDLRYIKSKMYDGIVNITARKSNGNIVSKKYVLFDLIIPDSDTFEYKDMLEVLYNRVNSNKIQFKKKDVSIIKPEKFEINNRKNSDVSGIEKMCLNDFISNNPNVSNIVLNSSVDVKYNFYIPVFQSCTVYQGKKYYNSIIGFRDKSGKGSNFCLNFPALDESIYNKLKFKYYFNNFLSNFFFLLGLMFIFFAGKSFLLLEESFFRFVFCLFVFLISFCFYSLCKKKGQRLKKQVFSYLNSKKMTKDEFYSEIIKKENKFVYHLDWS